MIFLVKETVQIMHFLGSRSLIQGFPSIEDNEPLDFVVEDLLIEILESLLKVEFLLGPSSLWDIILMRLVAVMSKSFSFEELNLVFGFSELSRASDSFFL